MAGENSSRPPDPGRSGGLPVSYASMARPNNSTLFPPLKATASTAASDPLDKPLPPAVSPPKTFAAAARSNSSGFFKPIQLVSRHYGVKDGFPSVSFSSSEIQEGSRRLQHTLVAKFSGGRPHVDEVRKAFISAWSLNGEVSIGAWDARHILIVIKSEQDACRVLSSSMRRVNNYWFRLFRWSADFHSRQEATVTSSWLKLLALPPHMYDVGIIKSIVSSFGKFLGVDERTNQFFNPSFARVCVEMDLAQRIPDKVWIGVGGGPGFWLNIEYENRLHYCTRCRIHGHLVDNCRKGSKKTAAAGEVAPADQPVHGCSQQLPEMVSGEWQPPKEVWHVQKRKKRVKRKNGQGIKDVNPVAAISPENESPQIIPTEEVQNNDSLESQAINDEGTTGKELVIFHQNEVDEETSVLQSPLRPTQEVEAQPLSSDMGESPLELESAFAQKFASYGNHIFAHNRKGDPLDGRGFFLAIKAQLGEDDATIFRGLDEMYNVATQALIEGSNSPVEASDGSVDLTRILKKARPRRSGRSRPKKKDANYEW